MRPVTASFEDSLGRQEPCSPGATQESRTQRGSIANGRTPSARCLIHFIGVGLAVQVIVEHSTVSRTLEKRIQLLPLLIRMWHILRDAPAEDIQSHRSEHLADVADHQPGI
jgi:hypothetical protein